MRRVLRSQTHSRGTMAELEAQDLVVKINDYWHIDSGLQTWYGTRKATKTSMALFALAL